MAVVADSVASPFVTLLSASAFSAFSFPITALRRWASALHASSVAAFFFCSSSFHLSFHLRTSASAVATASTATVSSLSSFDLGAISAMPAV